MFDKINILSFLLIFLISGMVKSQEIKEEEFSKLFEGNETAFILYDKNNDQVYRYNPEECSTRFRPAITFYILDALIGLETGAIKNENDTIKWDTFERRKEILNRDHTLKSAIEYSVFWYFTQLAKRIGIEKMQEYLNKVGYGNAAIGKRIDAFWLDGSLIISAEEQFDFLKKLYEYNLPFSQENINIVKDVLILEKTENYVLRGITGAGIIRSKGFAGWFIGYIETNDNAYIFVMNKKSKSHESAIEQAVNKTGEILSHFNLMNKTK